MEVSRVGSTQGAAGQRRPGGRWLSASADHDQRGAGRTSTPRRARRPGRVASGPYNICNGTCWQANGSGAQITVTNSPSNWTILSQNGYVKFQDGNGKCAYVGSSAGNPLNLGSNSCSSTYRPSSTQAFEQSCSGGSCKYTSAYSGPGGYPGRIQVFNTTSPHPVWVDVNSNLDAWITVVP